ncbi:hypothetical protein BJX61DRAFT_536065 [Aspergillus egyptiacus]|nr:hypothetical protein BJX61DRAFT_536065 [Aspergillus egyptiacus]
MARDNKGKKLKLGLKGPRDEFMRCYGDYLGQRTRALQQNFLHYLAANLGHDSLVRCVVKKKRPLLRQRDRDDRTPLQIAIINKNEFFLKAVLKEVKGNDLDSLLQDCADHEKNYVHTTMALINAASAHTLCATDDRGLTPLHLAADYERSSESQLSVVQALIARGDSAFDQYTVKPPDLSVYEYHEHTRYIAEVQARATEERERKAQQVEEERKSQPGVVKRHKDNLRGPSNVLAKRSASRGPPIRHRDIIETPSGNNPMVITVPAPERAEGFILRRTRTARIANEESAQKKAHFASKIQREIKLHYLRTTFGNPSRRTERDQLAARRFLYGCNVQNMNLSFDFLHAPSSISRESFEESFGHMRFDSVLRIVRFRSVTLRKAPVLISGKSSRFAHKPQDKLRRGKGRDDLVFFFNWLSGKGVKDIVKVVVDDLQEPSHSDAAIEACFQKLSIEILDWRKLDLCPLTLFNICHTLREVHLRWSGNRAILRAWSEREGLPRLEDLERVYIIWNAEQTLDSSQRIQAYIDDFKFRLERSIREVNASRVKAAGDTGSTQERRQIEVHVLEESRPTHDQFSNSLSHGGALKGAGEARLQAHRWLNCMDSFADEIQSVEIPASREEGLKSPIKVALIDDGVDPYVESLRGKIIGGESFDRGDSLEDGPSPYHTSSNGHGTVMADNICRICPVAKLFVYKLESHRTPGEVDGKHQMTAESAALAVKAAISQNVDIISMSWTVKNTQVNGKGIKDLGDAIKDALEKRILLFCAAADTGAITDVEYPFSYDVRRIFRVGAATSDGTVWGPTGNPQNLSFIVPGHNVVPRSPLGEAGGGGLPANFKEMTGSSIATALAAGLAALILHCIRLGIIQADLEVHGKSRPLSSLSPADLERARDHGAMREILTGIGLDQSQQKFIEVWRRFDGPADRLRSPGHTLDAKLEIIARLARDLVSCIPERG